MTIYVGSPEARHDPRHLCNATRQLASEGSPEVGQVLQSANAPCLHCGQAFTHTRPEVLAQQQGAHQAALGRQVQRVEQARGMKHRAEVAALQSSLSSNLGMPVFTALDEVCVACCSSFSGRMQGAVG